MTSPIFTCGFSFGMVPHLKVLAYSLTVEAASGNLRLMMPKRHPSSNDLQTKRLHEPLTEGWRDRDRLLQPELKQGFARDLNFVALGQYLYASASSASSGRADCRSFPATRNCANDCSCHRATTDLFRCG